VESELVVVVVVVAREKDVVGPVVEEKVDIVLFDHISVPGLTRIRSFRLEHAKELAFGELTVAIAELFFQVANVFCVLL